MRRFLKSNYWVILITIILFIIPFFWLHPNEMDLGGDSTRLYFYDPKNFLINDGLYLFEFVLEGDRAFSPHYYIIPHVLFLWLAQKIINSPYFWISMINGIKVSLSFFSIAMIISTLIEKFQNEKNKIITQSASVLGGLCYLCAPIIIGNYDKALITQYQVFLNPFIFYLLLLYIVYKKNRYLIALIFTTILFSPNFSWTAAPPIFAFYPLSLIFLFLISFVYKNRIPFKSLLIYLFFLLGLHAFHFIPEFNSLFNPGSGYSEKIFETSNITDSINYFYGVLPSSELSYNFFSYLTIKQFVWLGVLPILFIILAFIFSKKKNTLYLLTGLFYLVSLYLFTANITHSGVILYQYFFYIPGFSMFRNFVGQWAFVNAFFYAILFGQALVIVYKKIDKKIIIYAITFLLAIAQIAGAWNFFQGQMVNAVLFQSKNVKIPMVMDPKYEQTLGFIRSLKDDGAIASFPFTDCCYTVVHGLNNGAYVGPSPIRELTGFRDYNGYGTIAPFGEVILPLAKEKKYDDMEKLFGILNTRYIYYNDNPNIYDTTFPGYPYTSMRAAFPQTQTEYKTLIHKLAGKEIYHNGTYHIYRTRDTYFDPVFYTAATIKPYTNTKDDWLGKTESFFLNNNPKYKAYITNVNCVTLFSRKDCNNNINITNKPDITFEQVNLTTYRVFIKNAKKPFLLVFSDTYHPNWEMSLTQDNSFKDFWFPTLIHANHTIVNGFANAWYVLPKDVGNKTDYTLTIQLSDQKAFYIGSMISLATVIALLFYLIYVYVKK